MMRMASTGVLAISVPGSSGNDLAVYSDYS